MNLVCLVGEQPIPNMLPILQFKKKEVLKRTLLVCTSNERIKKAAERLKKLCEQKKIDAEILDIGDAYRLGKIIDKLREKISSQPDADWTFNLTGGTKLMSLAAAQFAADLKRPCVYYQTEAERNQSLGRLLYYQTDENGRFVEQPEKSEVLPTLITLEDFLHVHLDGYEQKNIDKSQEGWQLEEAVYNALKDDVDEIMRNIKPKGVKNQLEIDLLIRIGNQVGVVEVKTGGEGSGKKAVDQLTTVVAREYLGTYTLRFLVTQQAKDDRYKALAKALRVNVIELTSYKKNTHGEKLPPNDKQELVEQVQSKMPKVV